MKRVISWVVACIEIGLCACASEEPPAAGKEGEPTAGAEQSTQEASLASHMQLNFLLGIETRDAIIQGNLPLAQKRANDLGSHDYSKVLPEHWMGDVGKMQESARDVAQAGNLENASRYLAELAATCGDCHARLPKRGPDTEQEHGFSSKGPEDIETRMARHERAVDGMWFGLTMPSDASWRVGARALTEAPLSAPQVEGKPVDPALDAKLEAVRDLGRRALEAEKREERVAVFSELIGSCAGCHAPGT